MIPVRAESRTLAGPAPLSLKRDLKHSRPPRLAQDRKDLLDAIAELVEGTKERAAAAPPLEREALMAVVVLMRRRAAQLRAGGRRSTKRSA